MHFGFSCFNSFNRICSGEDQQTYLISMVLQTAIMHFTGRLVGRQTDCLIKLNNK